MHDAALVGGVYGAGECFDQFGGVSSDGPCACQEFRKAAAGDVFHRKERFAVDLSDFKDLHEVGMLQPGGCLRFGAKTGDGLDLQANAGNHLDRDRAAQLGLLRS